MSSRLLTIASLVTLTCLMAASFAQNNKSEKSASTQADQVEVKTDSFSRNVSVKMKPQVLIDTAERKLTMEFEYRVNQKELAEASFLVEESASITFESTTKQATDYGDRELHFLVDGNRLQGRRTSSDAARPILSERDEKGRIPDFSFYSSLTLSQVEKLAAGKQVRMRLGTIELPLSQPTLAAISEFAREFANHAPTRTKKKGAKP
jgi:hypothetical protein